MFTCAGCDERPAARSPTVIARSILSYQILGEWRGHPLRSPHESFVQQHKFRPGEHSARPITGAARNATAMCGIHERANYSSLKFEWGAVAW